MCDKRLNLQLKSLKKLYNIKMSKYMITDNNYAPEKFVFLIPSS